MGKKVILLLLLAVSAAALALPAAAAATPAHISSTGKFTLKGGKTVISHHVEGVFVTWECGEITGAGEFLNTTSGTLQLTFGPTCITSILGFFPHCQSSNPLAATGSVTTTPLRFDLIMVAPNKPGILLTPHSAGGVLAHVSCETLQGVSNFKFEGKGIIGTVKAPACGGSSVGMGLAFNAISHGVQEHSLYTGVIYHLTAGAQTVAWSTEAALTFSDGKARTLTCT